MFTFYFPLLYLKHEGMPMGETTCFVKFSSQKNILK